MSIKRFYAELKKNDVFKDCDEIPHITEEEAAEGTDEKVSAFSLGLLLKHEIDNWFSSYRVTIYGREFCTCQTKKIEEIYSKQREINDYIEKRATELTLRFFDFKKKLEELDNLLEELRKIISIGKRKENI